LFADQRRAEWRAVPALLVLVLAGCYEESRAPGDNYVPSTHAQRLNREALAALEAEKIEEALALAEQAIAEDPNFYEAYCNKAAISAQLGRYAGAANVLEQAIALRPKLAEPHVFRGIYLEKSGNADGARKAYEQAIALYDKDIASGDTGPVTAVNRAVAVYLLRGKVGGLTAFNDVLARYPEYHRALFLKQRIVSGDRDYFMWWVAHPERRDAPPDQESESERK